MRKENLSRIPYDILDKKNYVEVHFFDKNQVILLDFEDVEIINRGTLCITKTQTGHRYVYLDIEEKKFLLHRLIMNVTEKGYYVDHISHDTLDNRKNNLRVVSNGENMLNRKGAQVNSSSGYRGVHKNGKGKWIARVTVNGETIRLGTFTCPDKANEVVTRYRREHVPTSEMDKSQ